MNDQTFIKKSFGIARWILPFASIILCLFLNVSQIFAAPGEQINLSVSSSPLTQQINPKENQLFSIDLEENEVIRFRIDKEDLRLNIEVFDPDGKKLISRIYQRYGIVFPWFISTQAGKYRIEISSLEENLDNPSKLKLEVDKKRASRSEDYASLKAEELFQEGENQGSRWTLESLQKALELYKESARLWTEQKQWEQVSEANVRMGEIYSIFGDYQNALRFFNQAYSFAQRSGNRHFELEIIGKTAEISILIGDLTKVTPLLTKIEKEILKVVSTEERIHLRAMLHSRKAEVLAINDLEKARVEFQKALDIWREKPDRRGEAASLLNLGYLNFDSGEILASEQNFKDALSRWQALGDLRGQALTLTAQAHLYSFFEQSEKALELHSQAKEIFTQIGDRQNEAVALNGSGNIYESLGLSVDAASLYYRALQINEQLGNVLFMAATEFALARALRSQKKLNEAQTYYAASLQHADQVKMKRLTSYILTDLAEIDDESGKIDEALSKYQKSIPYYEEIKDMRGKALILNRIGKIYIQRNKIALAEKTYRQALQINNLTKDNAGVSDCLYHLAEIDRLRGNLVDALALVEKAIELTDRLHSKLLSSTLKIAHQSTVQEKIQLQIEVLMQLSKETPDITRSTEAFEKVEQSRARALREILENSHIRPELDTDSEQFKQVKEFEKKIAIKIEKQMSLMSSSPTDKKLIEIEHELDDLRIEYERLQTKINTESLNSVQLLSPPALRLTEIQAGLENNTVYLSYFLGKKTSYLWLLTTTDIKAFELAEQKILETATSEFYKTLTARQKRQGESSAQYRQRFEQAANRFCQQGENLFQLLLGQVTDDITDKRILVSFDGALQYIPLEALPVPPKNSPSGEKCRFVDDTFKYHPFLLNNEVAYTPSFSVLKTLREARQPNNDLFPSLAVWANPVYEVEDERLKGKNITYENYFEQGVEKELAKQLDLSVQKLSETELEANYITGLWDSDKAKIFTGLNVNRQQLINDLGKYQFVHIAAHGFFNSARPQHSGLILSKYDEQGARIGSVLSLQDIFRLRLQANLVVLSACQTGMGQNFSGEGLTGLKHAFFASGAKGLIVSFWKVDNRVTGVLMEEFYQNLLKEGAPAATALRQAKIKIYEQKGWEDPYFWAAFTVHGEYLVTTPRKTADRSFVLLCFVLASAIIFGEIYLWQSYVKKKLIA